MCHKVTCAKCNKPTWSGCGAHIEAVLGHVPKADRCACRAASSKGRSIFDIDKFLRGR